MVAESKRGNEAMEALKRIVATLPAAEAMRIKSELALLSRLIASYDWLVYVLTGGGAKRSPLVDIVEKTNG